MVPYILQAAILQALGSPILQTATGLCPCTHTACAGYLHGKMLPKRLRALFSEISAALYSD